MRDVALLVVSVLLAGCGDSKPPEKTFADPQVRALEKARGAQKQVEADADRRREAVDGQTNQ
jgi:major membrane immunogen (membrane-anchored lipoprotein)